MNVWFIIVPDCVKIAQESTNRNRTSLGGKIRPFLLCSAGRISAKCLVSIRRYEKESSKMPPYIQP